MEKTAENAAAWALLARVGDIYAEILGDLVGIYVHGSLAFGCFQWERSDLDFIVVVEEPPALTEKEKLIAALLCLTKAAPPKGLEMSVVLRRDCQNVTHPTPFALHFSPAHEAKCRANLREFCRNMQGRDGDLAAHFTVIREVGIVLRGEAKETVFGPVPRAAYLDSILADIGDAARGIAMDPVYYTLNLCRVLAYLREGRVLSKREGGCWGLEQLPRYRPVLEAALRDYAGGAGHWPEAGVLQAFAAEVLAAIRTET